MLTATSTRFQPHIQSEVSLLRQVVVHTPGKELALVSPENRLELLFDDILFEHKAKQEHELMCQLFRRIVGQEDAVLQIRDLLLDTFYIQDAREYLVEELIRTMPERNLQAFRKDMLSFTPEELLDFVLTGRSVLPIHALPLPNLMFTRDLCAVVHDRVILSKAATAARARESVLIRTIFYFHPGFEPWRKHILTLPETVTFEGGDLLVASPKLVLLGHSERTSFGAVMEIARQLLYHTPVEHVLVVDVPKQRASMHLDTVFTFCDYDVCVYFPPIIREDLYNVMHLTTGEDPLHLRSEVYPCLYVALNELLDRELTYIPCGGEDPLNQAREQWTDGANLFAVAPGVVVGYERNLHTFNALKAAGFQVTTTRAFLDYYTETPFRYGERVAIKLEGNELSRGRGGPRCMTMPLTRQTESHA